MTAPRLLILDTDYGPGAVVPIQNFLDLDDPRPAKEQFAERYKWGGWKNQNGFEACKLLPLSLQYPGDPILTPIAVMTLRHEVICIYPGAYVAIWQPDDTFEACCLD